MSISSFDKGVTPGTIVMLRGITDSPEMFVLECDRTTATCVWFNRNADLSQARFPMTALTRVHGD